MFNCYKKITFPVFLLVLAILKLSAEEDSVYVPKIGLVLSGGAAKGIAHIGVLKVIEKAGLHVDIIGGTSMGSIIGGLYACGYSAAQLEKIVLNQDWLFLLTDQLQRLNLSVKEKEEYDKYLISFPFENGKVKLPSGIGSGQNISLLLSQLTLPVDTINDFSKLPVPFFCIATDIVNAQEVILDHGYLPDAIRASMAIPTIFTPVEIDGHLLVDGGLVNNFPVDRAIDKGANIIIGVNLGVRERTKEELNNLTSVLEQSVFFQAYSRNNCNKTLCDILIQPDIAPNSAASFSNTAQLIKAGEDAAMLHFEELKELADSIKLLQNKNYIHKIIPVDSLDIISIQFEGLNLVPANFLRAKLRLDIPDKVSVKDLNEAIERAYGTQFFEKVTYKLQPAGVGSSVKLYIRVVEKTSEVLRFSARYDSQFKTQILLNGTFRNKLIKGSKLSIDLLLGESPRFRTEYRINTGWKYPEAIKILKAKNLGWFPDMGFQFDSRTYDFYGYNKDTLTSTYKYSYFTSSIFISTTVTNSLYFELGGSYDITHFNAIIASGKQKVNHDFFKFYGLIKQDTYNNYNFPTKGSLVTANLESMNDPGTQTYNYKPFFRWIFKAETTIPAGSKMTFIPRINTGMVYGDSIPVDYDLYVGGSYRFGETQENLFQFHGLKFLQKSSNAAFIAGLKIQYQVIKDHYVMIEANTGKIGDVWEDLFLSQDIKFLTGAGIEYGYDSFIGPIILGIYTNSFYGGQVISFFNLGFWF
jgi:NTE family protein